jgi:two-component system, chemotaxis family, chemotaxis protein CheY
MATSKIKPKKKLKIAIVDDSELTRKCMTEILTKAGFEVAGEASSAEKAMQILASASVNLFIIDIVMPGLSGLDLAKVLSEKASDVKTIIMSSLNMEHIVIESISHGAIDFLEKPFAPEDLINCIKKAEQAIQED